MASEDTGDLKSWRDERGLISLALALSAFYLQGYGKGGHVAALSHRRPCERQATKGAEGGKAACDFWLCLSPFLLPFCRGTGCRVGCNAHLLSHFEKGALEGGVLLGTKESRGKRRAHGKDFVLRGTLHGW